MSLPPVLAGCHLALHQIARGLLRKRFDEDDEDGDEDQMLPFPGLQQRYPSFQAGGERFRRRREKPLESAAPSQPPRHPWRAGWHFGASDLYLVSRQRRPAERRPRISPQLPACS